MKSVGAYEAKTNLSALLDQVAQGETITITRRGVAVALLMPVVAKQRLSPQEAVERIKAGRVSRTLGELSLEELKAEGRKG